MFEVHSMVFKFLRRVFLYLQQSCNGGVIKEEIAEALVVCGVIRQVSDRPDGGGDTLFPPADWLVFLGLEASRWGQGYTPLGPSSVLGPSQDPEQQIHQVLQ